MLVIGSRGSQLALWQARWVQARLAEIGEESRIEIIHTTGDKVLDVALSKVGSKGLFTKEIEEALTAGSIDLAVHSLKDLPTELPNGLTLAAIPVREDPRDALVGHRLSDLQPEARIGTSSLRRIAQLKALRRDLNLQNIRGNVDTRLRKLDHGQYDAILLAAAGLKRLGWASRITEYLDPAVMCPAVGQGALAIETRDDSGHAFQACRRLNDARTERCVQAERSVLATLGGGCQVPIGAHANLSDGGSLQLLAVVVSPEGSTMVRKETTSRDADPCALGRALAEELLESGAREILEAVYT